MIFRGSACSSGADASNVLGMTVIPLAPKPAPRSLAEAVSRTVRVLMAEHGVTQTMLAMVLGVSQTQVSSRLRMDTPWSLSDLEVLARYFGVTVAELVGGAPARGGPGDGGERARRDSNPQPSDPKVVPIRSMPPAAHPARKAA